MAFGRIVVAVSQAVPRAVSLPLGQDTKIVSRLKSLPRALRAVSPAPTPYRRAPYRGMSPAVSRHKGRPPTTIQTIVSRHTPVARPCARALLLAPHAGYMAVSWLLTSRVVALLAVLQGAWVPCRNSCCASQPCLPGPVCDTIPCIVTQHWKIGNSPSSLPCVEIFIYLFFSCFTHCKTPEEKKIFNTFFFISPAASLLLLKCSSLNTAIYPIQKFQEFNYKLFFLCKKLE